MEYDYVLGAHKKRMKKKKECKGKDQDCFGIWCQGSHILPLVKW